MEFSDVLERRRSIRSYNGMEVDDGIIREILEAMELAPSAGGLQAYRVFVEVGEEGIEKLGEAAGQADRVKGAGCIMVFFAVPEESGKKYGERGEGLYAVQDATLACAYAQLKATDLGLSSLWVGAFDDDEVAEACEVGNDMDPVVMLALGYSDVKTEARYRKKLKDLLL